MSLARNNVLRGFSPGQAVGGTVNTAIAAAGSTQANATTVNADLGIVTGADGTKGVILAGQAGDSVTLFNNSGSTLKVYPPSGAAIAVPGTGLGTGDAAFSHLTYKTVTYVCLSATQWLPTVTA